MAPADDAIDYMKRITAINPDQPFFIYYVPDAVHAPHHPTRELVKKITDMQLFDSGQFSRSLAHHWVVWTLAAGLAAAFYHREVGSAE